MPVYKVRTVLSGGMWYETNSARQAWYYARQQARILRRCHCGNVLSYMRVYNGDNQEYQAQPITRLVTAWG
ncbi:MAG: hypothetical protein BPHS0_30 [Phage 5P_3]|nr:MAG: hypothetical protein BPHS0_30 [Phage 5P_3]